jgi:hypothetical protein
MLSGCFLTPREPLSWPLRANGGNKEISETKQCSAFGEKIKIIRKEKCLWLSFYGICRKIPRDEGFKPSMHCFHHANTSVCPIFRATLQQGWAPGSQGCVQPGAVCLQWRLTGHRWRMHPRRGRPDDDGGGRGLEANTCCLRTHRCRALSGGRDVTRSGGWRRRSLHRSRAAIKIHTQHTRVARDFIIIPHAECERDREK